MTIINQLDHHHIKVVNNIIKNITLCSHNKYIELSICI